MKLIWAHLLLFVVANVAGAETYFITTDGKPENDGTGMTVGAIRWDAWFSGNSFEGNLAPKRWHSRLPFYTFFVGYSPAPPVDNDGIAKQPQPLPPDLVAAWKEAGATVGWMPITPTSDFSGFRENLADKELAIPAFRFVRWPKDAAMTRLAQPQLSSEPV